MSVPFRKIKHREMTEVITVHIIIDILNQELLTHYQHLCRNI